MSTASRPAADFVCRGVVYSSQGAPLPHGVAQVSTSFDFGDHGILYGAGLEFRTNQPAGAVLGGTGRFAGVFGTYVAEGAPVELGGDGRLNVTFRLGGRD